MKNQPFKIAIASGKGGTGKTTVAVNLHHFLAAETPESILLVDCDVEEPNDLLFYPDAEKTGQEEVTRLVPEIRTEACTFCRKCVDYCEFNALVVIPPVEFAEVNKELCHSCGACSVACEYGAIVEKPEPIGSIATYRSQKGAKLMEGTLKVGSSMQTMLIRSLKKAARGKANLLLFDSPPGTSCPVVTTISDADYVILVTEPTPFGLYDLQLTVSMVREVGKSFGVIVNKSGLGDDGVYRYLEEEDIELLGEIPFEQAYARRYAEGALLADIPESVAGRYRELTGKILAQRVAAGDTRGVRSGYPEKRTPKR